MNVVAVNVASPPSRSRPQHLMALEHANRVRLARAELKRRVADGDVSVADVVLDAPLEAERMEICELLMSQRRWGLTRCRRFLATIPVPENKTIGSLTERQRHALAARLSDRVGGDVLELVAAVA